MPKVSVCLSVYKTNPEYLRACLESVLSQTFTDFEFLIADDCPEDSDCEKIIKSYTDARIKYFRNAHNLGISASRNKLLSLAAGEYIAVMDHDDISLPERLAKQTEYLDKHPECGVVGCWYQKNEHGPIKKKKETSEQILLDMVKSCPILHPASMLRKSVLIDNDITYNAATSPCEDFDLWCRLAGKTELHNLPEVLFIYRDHLGNTSKQYAAQMKEIRHKILNDYQQRYPQYFGLRGFFRKLLLKLFKLPSSTEKKAHKLYKKYHNKPFSQIGSSEFITKKFNQLLNFSQRRGIIFASYSATGKIENYVIYYLKQLKKYADFIIFVADNDTSVDELQKLACLVDIAHFQRHGQYDFGSYKIGYFLAEQQHWLENIDTLLFCNDSIIGPVNSLDDLFLQSQNNDFYGLSGNIYGYLATADKIYNIGCKHLQSFFFSLSSKFFKHPEFKAFLSDVTFENNKIDVIINYEIGLSRLARRLGFTASAYLPYQEDVCVKNWKLFLEKSGFIKKRILPRLSYLDRRWLRKYLHNHGFDSSIF